MLHIYWFRKDLRLTDNRALCEFNKSVSVNDKFLFLYIKNRNSYEYFGEKRVGFLFESLICLKVELNALNFHLEIIEGKIGEGSAVTVDAKGTKLDIKKAHEE